MMTRRMLPVIVVLALGLGALERGMEQRGLADAPFATAVRTLLELGLLASLLWWAAARVRRDEQALLRSDADVRHRGRQLAAFLDTAAIALHRVGPDGRVLWVNDAELKLLGYSRDEYVGRPIADFYVDDDVIADMLDRLRRGEALYEHPARMRCKDGSIKHVLVDSSVLWEDGRFLHTQCFTRDVTERRNAEQASALLGAIVRASADAIVSKTLDGVITSWNEGAARIFGYTAAEAIGRHIELILPPDRRGEEREILTRLRRGESLEHFETVRRTKDGRAVHVSLTVSPVKDRLGNIVGASKIARDITDRKRLEAERAENERRKDEFLAILAHELRNPLGPVRNAARYLQMKYGEDPELRRPLDMIERQTAQMSRLIEDLLDVSRISRGMLELRREQVSSSEVVEAAIDACRDQIRANEHTLRVSMPPDPIVLYADRERLVQLLSNLIGNAAKYTPRGGRIDLAVAVGEDGMVSISVKDDGIGIPPEKLAEIFELFARVDRSIERQDGLGIGLTVVRQLVEIHGGTVEAKSEGVGRGSEFVVRLPLPAAPPADVAPSPVMRSSTPLRIVVADDNADAVESLALLLRLGGHEVHTADDGKSAFEAIETRRPDVAFVDIGMPNSNGYEVAQRVRGLAQTERTYLVALTGWGQDADKRRAVEAGFDAHLVKPVSLEALEQLLARAAQVT
jgi:PAS domain S-box-containing protein